VSLGAVKIAWNSNARLTQVEWMAESLFDTYQVTQTAELTPQLKNLAQAIRDFFAAGEPIDSSGKLDWSLLDCSGMTAFQESVYRAILQIPHGETRTYSWVAQRVGRANATRAVGQALKNNPFPILIPCHRVTSMHSLGGFMGITDPDRPEVGLKRFLLSVEEQYHNPVFSFLSPRRAESREVSSALISPSYSKSASGSGAIKGKISGQINEWIDEFRVEALA
jgi:methylated-DNA-[protein]-cysteine S-methyltransferase